jgi:hypothetical protein
MRSKNFLSMKDEYGITNEQKLADPHFVVQGYNCFMLGNIKIPLIVILVTSLICLVYSILLRMKILPRVIHKVMEANKNKLVLSLVVLGVASTFTKLLMNA